MSEQPLCHVPAPQLRLFEPYVEGDLDAPRFTRDTTIRTYCEQHFFPRRLRKADPKTVIEYRTTLKYFIHCFGNLAIGRINDTVLIEFIERLEAMPGKVRTEKLSDATVAKHIRQFEAILTTMGPKTRRHRYNAEVFTIAPFFPESYQVGERHKRKPFTIDEFERLWTAARVARKPKLAGVSAPEWWRGLFDVLFNVGARIETALTVEPVWIDRDGYAEVPTEHYKQGEARTLYFNPWARGAIAALHPPGTKRRRTFAGVSLDGAGMVFDPRDQVEEGCCRRYLDELFKEIMLAADVPVLKHRVWHGFRRTLGDQLFAMNPAVAQFQLGHSSLEVTKEHYIDGRSIGAWMDQLRQPRRITGDELPPRPE